MSQDFLTKIPEVPIVQKAVEAVGAGLDYLINEKLIGGLGKCLDACTAEVRGMGKAGIGLGGGLAGGLDSAPALSASNTPSPSPSQGQSPSMEKSVGPEKVRNMAMESVSGTAKGMQVAEVSQADLGNFSPSAVGVAQTKSQGMAMG